MKFNSEVYGKVYHPQAEPTRRADGFIKKPEKTEPEKTEPEETEPEDLETEETEPEETEPEETEPEENGGD